MWPKRLVKPFELSARLNWRSLFDPGSIAQAHPFVGVVGAVPAGIAKDGTEAVEAPKGNDQPGSLPDTPRNWFTVPRPSLARAGVAFAVSKSPRVVNAVWLSRIDPLKLANDGWALLILPRRKSRSGNYSTRPYRRSP